MGLLVMSLIMMMAIPVGIIRIDVIIIYLSFIVSVAIIRFCFDDNDEHVN